MNLFHRIGNISAGVCAAALSLAATSVSAQPTPLMESSVEPAKPAATVRINSARRAYPLVNASEAQRRLAQSQLKRKQGKAPLAGERAQNSGELTYAYWRRQEKLRIEVEQAQRRANAVQMPLLAGTSKM